jgi:hypothetical protein
LRNKNLPLLTELGDPNACFKVYIGNRPDFLFANEDRYTKGAIPLEKNEIYACGQACGNGWRKVFNVYAKVVYATGISALMVPAPYKNDKCPPASWQAYRDTVLLQKNSNTALVFSPINNDTLSAGNPDNAEKETSLHLIMGKTYANSVDLPSDFTWVNHEFAVSKRHKVIVCPYFDYRQLSNIKIVFLVDLIRQVMGTSSNAQTSLKND